MGIASVGIASMPLSPGLAALSPFVLSTAHSQPGPGRGYRRGVAVSNWAGSSLAVRQWATFAWPRARACQWAAWESESAATVARGSGRGAYVRPHVHRQRGRVRVGEGAALPAGLGRPVATHTAAGTGEGQLKARATVSDLQSRHHVSECLV